MTNPTHILTVLTPDRRGIIAGITAALDEAGAGLIELSQTVVRDYFTILMVLNLPPELAAERVVGAVRAKLASSASVNLVAYSPGPAPVALGERYVLTATGADSAGVEHTIAALIAERGGNFSDFSSRVADNTITIIAEVDLPREVALDQLQIDLAHAGFDAGLQVRLQHHRLFVATNEIAFRRV